jgi:hypothetical protein
MAKVKRRKQVTPIVNAEDATRVVRDFLSELGWQFVTPVSAERKDSQWSVVIGVGFTRMEFEIDADTGQILRYREQKKEVV